MLKIAFRNLFRNGHRTLVTTLAMGFAGGIMILFAALMEGMLLASERNAVSMDVGEIQIHAKGYRDDPDLYTRIEDAPTLLARLDAEGFAATPRLYGFGLAAAGSASAGVQLRGLDIARESKVSEIHRHLLEGNWLSADEPQGVVIGRKLSRILGIGQGDELVFVGQASDGSMANELYRVRGVLKSVSGEIDRSALLLPQAEFRTLMAVPVGSHEIVVMRGDQGELLVESTRRVSALAPDHETLNWRELRPIIARILEIADTQLIVMILLTYVAVAMVVLNAMLMGVFERIREFGVMKAVGVTPGQIVRLIYLETLLQTALASVLALLLGWPLAARLQESGIDLTHMLDTATFGGIALDPIWYTHISNEVLATPILFLFVIAAVAVIYPALVAATIQPVKAIHYQ